MDELILRHLNGEATDVEQHRLEKWRAAAPENEARYQEARAVWVGMGSVRTPRGGSRPDVGAMIAEGERRRARWRARRSARAFLRSPWVGYGTAVAAGLALALFAYRSWQVRNARPGAGLVTVESTVGPGRVVAMTLSDGTFLRAVEGASLEFPAESGQREVVLEGTAFFAVAPGSEPFVVRTDAGELEVMGTRFEVRAAAGELRVVVVEGKVALSGPGGDADLGAGQVARVRSGGAPEVTTVSDVWALLDWPSGLLAFQGTPLLDVAGQIEHHYGVDVRVEDSLASSRHVTGSFRDDSLDEVVGAVCALTGIRCEREGDTFILGAPPR